MVRVGIHTLLLEIQNHQKKKVQESDSFAVWDAVDGIVALGWENMEGYDEYPEKRLFFTFGEEISSVEDKLYEKDMVINYNNETINT
jgi:hypothetical protein